MIEGEEQELILNTLAEQPQEEIRTLEEDIYVIGVESLNGQAGDLTLKNINGEDLVGEGNIALQTPLTETQMDAVDSGIDSTKVAQIATNAGDITTLQNTKQDNLTQAQLNAVNSGIDQTKVAQIATNTGNITSNTNRISAIEGKIPSAASSSNQLTDKNYVDNSIATNTANYISDNGQPFQSYADLVAYSGTLTNNDYAFVVSTDAAGNLLYTRYKYNASQNLWAEEYTIANPTFTSDQWASINSGVTANDVSQIGTNKTDIANLTTSKQDALSQTQLDAVNSGIDATKVQQIADNTTAIATKQDKLIAGTNIQIAADGKTISATDTKYTAGTGLTLTGTQFSVTEPVPAGFFTDTASTQEGEGTQFTLNNTTDAPIDGVELKGDTFQQTYTGKNLASLATSSEKTIGGVSFTIQDGVISITGTTQANKNFFFDSFQTSSGSATFWVELSGYTDKQSSNDAFILQESSDGSTWATGAEVSALSTAVHSRTITLDSTKYYRVRWFTNSGTWTNAQIRVQLELGSKTTFEPYVGGIPAPNPTFPEPVNVVTGEQTVKVTGKNLLDISQAGWGYINANGVPTATSNPSNWLSDFIKVEPNKTYTLSITNATSGDTNIALQAAYYDNNQGFISREASASGLTRSFTTPNDCGWIRVWAAKSPEWTAETKVSYKPQLELGSATAHQPYQSQSYEVNLGKNLLDLSVQPTSVNGVTTSYDSATNSLSVASTGSGSGYIYARYDLKTLKPGNTYSIKIGSFTNASVTNERILYIASYNGSSTTQLLEVKAPNLRGTFTVPDGSTEIRVYFYTLLNTTSVFQEVLLEAGSTATTYAPYFTPIELCKIGTYQDYIWKDGSDWKIHKAIGKAVFDGNQGLTLRNTSQAGTYTYAVDTPFEYKLELAMSVVSDSFTYLGSVIGATQMYSADKFLDKIGIALYHNSSNPGMHYVYFNAKEQLPTWLVTHNIAIYYVVETPTDTTITDAGLIAQLEALAGSTTYAPQTNYATAGTGTNLPVILTVDVFKNNYAGLLARLEKAGA